MKIFLSAVETNPDTLPKVVEMGYKPMWNLMSYYYVKTNDPVFNYVCDHSEEVLIDSGAHSIMAGKRMQFDKYTIDYGSWIKEHDRANILGFFEMDIDDVIGVKKVDEYREYLYSCSNKIIPVWHPIRGIDAFKKMCKEQRNRNRIVAIPGFRNECEKNENYGMFIKYAWDNGCKIHCLGGTRKSIIDKFPFDYVDSSSWKQEIVYGRLKGCSSKLPKGVSANNFMPQSYIQWMDVQRKYYDKWRFTEHDN